MMCRINLTAIALIFALAIGCGDFRKQDTASENLAQTFSPNEPSTPSSKFLNFVVAKKGTYTYEGSAPIDYDYEIKVSIPKNSIAEISCSNNDFQMRYVSYSSNVECKNCYTMHPADGGMLVYSKVPVNAKFFDKQNGLNFEQDFFDVRFVTKSLELQKFNYGTSSPNYFLDSHVVLKSFNSTYHKYRIKLLDKYLNGSPNTRSLKYSVQHNLTNENGLFLPGTSNTFSTDALNCVAKRSPEFVEELSTYFQSIVDRS